MQGVRKLDLFLICKYNLEIVDTVRGRHGSLNAVAMHIIARRKIREFVADHSDAENWLDRWWKAVGAARWERPDEVKAEFPAVDRVGECFIFDVCGNKYRLIVKIRFAPEEPKDHDGTVFIRFILTHKEYDQDAWKEDCRR